MNVKKNVAEQFTNKFSVMIIFDKNIFSFDYSVIDNKIEVLI